MGKEDITKSIKYVWNILKTMISFSILLQPIKMLIFHHILFSSQFSYNFENYHGCQGTMVFTTLSHISRQKPNLILLNLSKKQRFKVNLSFCWLHSGNCSYFWESSNKKRKNKNKKDSRFQKVVDILWMSRLRIIDTGIFVWCWDQDSSILRNFLNVDRDSSRQRNFLDVEIEIHRDWKISWMSRPRLI